MASKDELRQIAHRMVDDQDFSAEFKKDPRLAAASMGITLTEEQVERFQQQVARAEEEGLRESKAFPLMEP